MFLVTRDFLVSPANGSLLLGSLTIILFLGSPHQEGSNEGTSLIQHVVRSLTAAIAGMQLAAFDVHRIV